MGKQKNKNREKWTKKYREEKMGFLNIKNKESWPKFKKNREKFTKK